MTESNSDHSVSEMRAHGLWLVASVAILLLAFLLENRDGTTVGFAATSIDLPPLCTSQRVWGLDCPGCGLTRSFIALAHGDAIAALRYNTAGLLIFAFFALQIPYRAAQLIRLGGGYTAWRPFGNRERWLWTVSILVLTAVMISQWLVRVAWPKLMAIMGMGS